MNRLHAGTLDSAIQPEDGLLAGLNPAATAEGITLVELRRQRSTPEEQYGALLADSFAGSRR